MSSALFSALTMPSTLLLVFFSSVAQGFRQDPAASFELGTEASVRGGSSSLEQGRETQQWDEQLYPSDFKGPENLTVDEEALVGRRIARCYEPRADQNYDQVAWREALDNYMKKQVVKGLRHRSYALIYDMPHVWGKSWFTKFLPHHWISAVIPDTMEGHSTQCLEFDYQNATEDTDDPAGCLYFKKSFQPSKILQKCVRDAFSASTGWKGRRQVFRMRGNPLHKAIFNLSTKSGPLVMSIKTTHAKWNKNADVIRLLYNEVRECSLLQQISCSHDNATRLSIVENNCFMGRGNATVECEHRHPGSDAALATFLQGKEVFAAGTMCNDTHMTGVHGRVALIEPDGCDAEDKMSNSIMAGAVAVLLAKGNKTYSGYGEPRGKKPIPMFIVSATTAQALKANLTEQGAATIDSYTPELPADAAIVPNFAEEVNIWAEDGSVASLSIRDRAYELIKKVSMEDLDHTSLARARFTAARAFRYSSTQPLKTKFDQIDAATEDALFKCYHLTPAPEEHESTWQEEEVEQDAADEDVSQEDRPWREPQGHTNTSTEPGDMPADGPSPNASNASSQLQRLEKFSSGCKTVRVVSAGYRLEYGRKEEADQAEFFIDGERIDFTTEEGVNVVVIRNEEVFKTTHFDTTSWTHSGEKPLREALNDLPEGDVVLIAVKGDGMGPWMKKKTIQAFEKVGAKYAGLARSKEGYVLIGQKGGMASHEKFGRFVQAESALPCAKDPQEPVPEQALLVHEASKCFPNLLDKVEVGGPPFPQVTDARGSFSVDHYPDSLRVIDALGVHPICSRLSMALISRPMSFAPYPNPDEWAPGADFSSFTGYDALKKGNPQWIAEHVTEFCLNPDTAVCTSFTVCWAMVTRHITKLVHKYCDEALRPFPEMTLRT